MKNFLIAGLLVAAAALGLGGWYFATAGDPPVTHVTAIAQRGSLERSVSALGKVEPQEYVDVGAQISGQLMTIHVQPGDFVHEGDLLAELDPTVYRARVEADRATLVGLEAQLAERRAMLRLAEQQHQRQQGLLKANATSREAFDAATAEVEASRARLAVLEAEISKARSTLEADEANLSYTQIRAPMAGTVMSLSARQGQTLNANQQAPIILQIADLETMTVRTQVSEADVGKLQPGMDAYFTILGDTNRRWTGKLRQILPTPEVVNDVVLYNALFEVDNTDRRLLPQMSAQVFFIQDRVEDAVLVPMAAVQPGGERGRRVVQVLTESGELETRPVRVGISDRISIQIVEGIEEGERVVLNSGGAYRPDMAGGPGMGPGAGRSPRIGGAPRIGS
ncbi:efflux RND transporter periplasmic adaptor subunit [Telmatospirillum sp. J64-1]|uniref:efflux RND transporter periplasmic adaptor subunit n=1 Tax=Telmatospirillum sp. J64-1 TaxID=2502183 RepID=UPI00115F7000|nr:efflux RND transporter periplasmic adaptor subunit [Telmatospirillum sp. J64-1]